MPFVLLAVLWSTIAVSAVLVMYMLVRRWLLGDDSSPWWPATPLGPRRSCSPAAPSDDRRGFLTSPHLFEKHAHVLQLR